MKAARRTHVRFVLAALLLLGALQSSTPAAAQQVGSACSPANKVIYPTYLNGSSNAYVCDGAHLVLLESDTAVPLQKGIGTATPQATLDVNGEVRIGNTGLACSATTVGAMRYNSVNLEVEYCNGTSWTGSAGGTPAGATTQIQFNSSGAFGADPNLTWNSATGTLMSDNYDTTAAAGVYKINGTAVIMIPGVSADPTGESLALGSGVLVSDNHAVGDVLGWSENSEFNTGVGYSALHANTGGAGNTALGYSALSHNTTGDLNTAVGAYAFLSNTTGIDNTAIGEGALAANTTGNANTAVGEGALTANTGIGNTAVGSSTFNDMTTGGNNTAIGYEAGFFLKTGNDNTLVGMGAGVSVTGSSNIILGVGGNITTGGSNILIGNSLTNTAAGGSNQLDIGDTITGNTATKVVGIGVTTPAAGLTLGVNGNVGATAYCDTTGANCIVPGSSSATTWNGITNPTGALALAMGSDTSTFTYGAATGAISLFNLTDTNGNTGTGYLLNLATGTGSALKPFHVSINGGATDALTVLANGNVGIRTATPKSALDVGGGVAIGSYAGTNAAPSNGLIVSGQTIIGLPSDFPDAVGPHKLAVAGTDGSNVFALENTTATQQFAFYINNGFPASPIQMGSITNSRYGIFTNNAYPQFTLDPNGGAEIGSGYYAAVPPASGLIVQGNVGIGTTTPQATLDVNGYLRLAKNSSQPVACSSTNDGAVALTHVYTLCLCKGASTSWVQSKDGATACSW